MKNNMRKGMLTIDATMWLVLVAILVGGVVFYGKSLISGADIDGSVKDPTQQMLLALPGYKQGNMTEAGTYNGLDASTLSPFVATLKHDNSTPPGFLSSKRGSDDIQFTILPHDAAASGANNRTMIFMDCSSAPLSEEEKALAEQKFASTVITQSPGAFILGTATSMPAAATAKSTSASVNVDSDCKIAAVNIR